MAIMMMIVMMRRNVVPTVFLIFLCAVKCSKMEDVGGGVGGAQPNLCKLRTCRHIYTCVCWVGGRAANWTQQTYFYGGALWWRKSEFRFPTYPGRPETGSTSGGPSDHFLGERESKTTHQTFSHLGWFRCRMLIIPGSISGCHTIWLEWVPDTVCLA